MNTPDDLQLIPLERLKGLSYDQWTSLISKGVLSVESFLGIARSRPEELAKFLGCSSASLNLLVKEAEALVGPKLDKLEAPRVPPMGLVPPKDRPNRDERRPKGGESK